MSDMILTVRNLYKSYGPIKVLKDVSLTIGRGEAHVVIGPNGAGKTTLFKCLSGEALPNSGVVTLDDVNVTNEAGWQRTRRGVGRTFQVARVYPDLTTYENLVVSVEARHRFDPPKTRSRFSLFPNAQVLSEVDELIAEMGLAHVASRDAKILSHGDKKRLELAMSLALRPRLLMLDEPTAGMSPSDRKQAVAFVSRIRKEHGLSMLLTEHDMDVVFGLATELTVLHHGEVIASGEPSKVRAEPRVREVYLGHG
jgi:branched-chain amino acid transport system ATP-binding protein